VASDEPQTHYDYQAIKFLVDELHRWDADGGLVPRHRPEPIRVIYEEFVTSRAATLGRVLDALGIAPREPDDGRGPMRRQADNMSQDWVERFRHDDLKLTR